MYQFWQINLTTYTNPTWTKFNKSNDLRTNKARQWSDLGVIKIWLIISPSVFPKFGADLVYLISDCALFRKYGWLWSRRKPHLGLNVTMITYLPARTLPLGFGDTPVVPPEVINQDISPFVLWKSFSNFCCPSSLFMPSNPPMSILVSDDHVWPDCTPGEELRCTPPWPPARTLAELLGRTVASVPGE